MNIKTVAGLILVLYLGVASFGLFSLGHMGHGEGCPLMQSETLLCAVSLEYLKEWQSVFVGVIFEMIVFAVALFYIRPEFFRLPDKKSILARVHARGPDTPTLLQELFSGGVLNPKAP